MPRWDQQRKSYRTIGRSGELVYLPARRFYRQPIEKAGDRRAVARLCHAVTGLFDDILGRAREHTWVAGFNDLCAA
jgi:hypothetical protein